LSETLELKCELARSGWSNKAGNVISDFLRLMIFVFFSRCLKRKRLAILVFRQPMSILVVEDSNQHQKAAVLLLR
jgi:hypothetical protein